MLKRTVRIGLVCLVSCACTRKDDHREAERYIIESERQWAESVATGDTSTTRIASNIVQGIGFLGAGVILREKGSVVGMTTAATIFLEAAMGMAAGSGLYKISGFVCFVVLFALVVLVQIEKFFKLRSRYLLFRIASDNASGLLPEIHQLFGEMKLPLDQMSVSLAEARHILQFEADLSQRQQEKVTSRLCELGLAYEMLPAERQNS